MALSSDAKMAINFEHAWGDGVAVVRFLNEVCSTSSGDVYTPTQGGAATGLSAKKLDFELDDSVKGSIKTGMYLFLLAFICYQECTFSSSFILNFS